MCPVCPSASLTASSPTRAPLSSQQLLRTDISPQRKDAQPLSHALTSDSYNFLTSRLWGLGSDDPEVAIHLIGYFPIPYNPPSPHPSCSRACMSQPAAASARMTSSWPEAAAP